MRIGIDCRLPTYRMGGISQSVLHLLPALAAVDSTNEYILFHSRKESRSFVPKNAPNFTRCNLWTPCHHRIERWALAAELVRHRLDVFHSPDFIPPQFGAKRKIVTIHDLNFIFFPQFLTEESKRYYVDQIDWASNTADHIAVDSYATEEDVINQLDVYPDKVTTIHLAANPLYKQDFPSADVDKTMKKFGFPRGFILCVGTLEPRKNLPMLIEAYAKLRKENDIEVPLILIGSKGWIFEEIFETINRLRLQQNVHHLSGIFDEELAHFYHAAGILVTPSHYEGFGLPALEAQHCGCPVVVSSRGSLPEIVGEDGLMLEPDDIEGWVDSMARVLTDNDLRTAMIRKGKEQAARFDWLKSARETIALYTGNNE